MCVDDNRATVFGKARDLSHSSDHNGGGLGTTMRTGLAREDNRRGKHVGVWVRQRKGE